MQTIALWEGVYGVFTGLEALKGGLGVCACDLFYPPLDDWSQHHDPR